MTIYFYCDGSSYEGTWVLAPHYKDKTKLLHCENGPAVIYPNGDKRWYINGKLHRENGPAIEYEDGRYYFYIEGYYIQTYLLKKILFYKRKSSLIQYLLSNNSAIRFFAQKRVQELDGYQTSIDVNI